MARLFCKYCKKRTHRIDECPTIICRDCGERGHPTWHCPKQASGSRLKKARNAMGSKPRRRPEPVPRRAPEAIQRRVVEWPTPSPPQHSSLWDFLDKRGEVWADL